ncbi:hypothetical protein ZIOFF_002775 [Zingiber officinale]|uniref:30S ribosomal protein S20, chloroplastic n=1 Tax=Zingiber officinale TaxID=94328 RepID=A0A8J5IMB7_ZINOF|nr:hypothetical protein ZIOFF_002775 [Zingiber officinale]
MAAVAAAASSSCLILPYKLQPCPSSFLITSRSAGTSIRRSKCPLAFASTLSLAAFPPGLLSAVEKRRAPPPGRPTVVCEAVPKKYDSATKRARQGEKRRIYNKARKSEIRTRMKKVHLLLYLNVSICAMTSLLEKFISRNVIFVESEFPFASGGFSAGLFPEALHSMPLEDSRVADSSPISSFNPCLVSPVVHRPVPTESPTAEPLLAKPSPAVPAAAIAPPAPTPPIQPAPSTNTHPMVIHSKNNVFKPHPRFGVIFSVTEIIGDTVLESLDELRKKSDAQSEELLPIEKLIAEAFSVIDKAVRVGTLHRNTGDRRKSRLSRRKKAVEIHHGWYVPAAAS